MNYPILINTISMELSILYLKGLAVSSSIKLSSSVPEDYFYLAMSADPYKVSPLPKFLLADFYNENG